MWRFAGALLVAVGLIACAGGGSKENETPAGENTAVTTAPPAATTTVAPQAAGLSSLSLVYIDTSKGQGAEVYVASYNGAQPKLVTTSKDLKRPLDVAGRNLAAAGTNSVLFIDLTTGQMRTLDTGADIFDGKFTDSKSFMYTTRAGCGGPTLSNTTVYIVDASAQQLQPRVLLSQPGNLAIAGVDSQNGTVALAPRGCDVGVNGYKVVSVRNGATLNTFEAMGCGWIIAASGQNKAAASWKACTPPAAHANADATVYDFGIVGPTGNDVKAPDGGSNTQAWLLRPNSAQAALATTTTVGQGPGSTRAGGVYLIDLNSRAFSKIANGEGAEQSAVRWTSDGRYLMYQIVEAQGVCRYAYVDANTNGSPPQPVNAAITVCGVNGTMVGWTNLK